eukprot:COSAG06_NODE_894_length_11709_cov_6.062010_11_plen_31_part_00
MPRGNTGARPLANVDGLKTTDVEAVVTDQL